MNIDNLISETAKAIRTIGEIGDTEVFEEDKGNIANNIEASVAQTCRCIVVGWNGCDHVASERSEALSDPDALYVEPEIVVSVYESPVVNRQDDSAPRILGMAQAIAKAVNDLGTEDMNEGLHFVKITPLQELKNGVVACDVVFKTKNAI